MSIPTWPGFAPSNESHSETASAPPTRGDAASLRPALPRTGAGGNNKPACVGIPESCRLNHLCDRAHHSLDPRQFCRKLLASGGGEPVKVRPPVIFGLLPLRH